MKELQDKFDAGEIIEFAKTTIVFTSKSKWRKKLLDEAGIKYVVITSDFDDTDINYQHAHTGVSKKEEKNYAREMAIAKMQPFVGKIKNGIVITADTTLFCQGRILEKPLTKERCKEQHSYISGKKTYIYTSIAAYYNGKILTDVLVVKCKIHKLSPEIIEEISNEEETLNCAGFRTGGAIRNHMTFKEKHHPTIIGICPKALNKLVKKITR